MMANKRYLAIKVGYEPDPRCERSLEWIAPELRHAGLRLVEDRNDKLGPSRTWAGIVDATTFERFAEAWHLDACSTDPHLDPVADHGRPATRSYTLDGMNWESGGESPIVYVSVQVTLMPSTLAPANRAWAHDRRRQLQEYPRR